MDDSPLFLAQNVSRALDAAARMIEVVLKTGVALSLTETRYLLGLVKDAQRDIAPLAYPTQKETHIPDHPWTVAL